MNNKSIGTDFNQHGKTKFSQNRQIRARNNNTKKKTNRNGKLTKSSSDPINTQEKCVHFEKGAVLFGQTNCDDIKFVQIVCVISFKC